MSFKFNSTPSSKTFEEGKRPKKNKESRKWQVNYLIGQLNQLSRISQLLKVFEKNLSPQHQVNL